MKRDLDLVRDILRYFEERESISLIEHADLAAELGRDDLGVVAYHVRLLAQAGFLSCELVKSTTSDRIINAWPFELTWDGHEFIKLSRDQAWNDAKRRLGDGFANASFDVVKTLLLQYAKSQLGLDAAA